MLMRWILTFLLLSIRFYPNITFPFLLPSLSLPPKWKCKEEWTELPLICSESFSLYEKPPIISLIKYLPSQMVASLLLRCCYHTNSVLWDAKNKKVFNSFRGVWNIIHLFGYLFIFVHVYIWYNRDFGCLLWIDTHCGFIYAELKCFKTVAKCHIIIGNFRFVHANSCQRNVAIRQFRETGVFYLNIWLVVRRNKDLLRYSQQ